MDNYLASMDKQIELYINCVTRNFSDGLKQADRWNFVLEGDACNQLQLFNSGYDIEVLRYDDLCNLAWLLTKQLHAQITRDHYIYWTWCGFIGNYFKMNLDRLDKVNDVFKDSDWFHSFNALLNLLLLRNNNIPPFYENYFLFRLSLYRAVIAGPLCYSVLEGLLRRRNSRYVTKGGRVLIDFGIDIGSETIEFGPNKRNNHVFRMHHSLALFEQLTIKSDRQNRKCIGLQELKQVSVKLHEYDTFDKFIDMGRNTLLHGEKYWQTRYPIVMNLLCLLLIDSITPEIYNSNLNNFKDFLNAYNYERSSLNKLSGKEELLKQEIFYPPNMTY
jgi:hypothetical protein